MPRLVGILFFASLVVLALGLYRGDELPAATELLPALAAAPLQTPAVRKPFDVTVNDVDYHIEPLYRYELYGLVVSKHMADGLIDYVHKQWSDHLNTADLCVVWGKVALSGIYTQFSFASGQWTCWYQTHSSEAWQQFSEDQLSNNHILSDQANIRSLLKEVRVGDQIYVEGHLAKYSHDGGFQRGSSTTRTDRGNGACETVFAEELRILKHSPALWRTLRWGAAIMLLLLSLLWFLLPPVVRQTH
ncbi:hypothetical protein AGMMS50289_22160 [Betaproteobacteria bacterium]|nr:hypothetical protein AGMMS50289_22160 [Betaproteobacteria bacterium]